MRFTETLCDLGDAVPGVLTDIVSRGAGATALECIRKLACTGNRITLADPPPALLHPSKLAYANLLHSGRKPCPLRDGPYLSVSDKTFFESALHGICVGGLIVDVSDGQSRPAVVFARPNEAERRLEIVIHVYGAPFAAMEAELFSGAGAPSAFEKNWLAERATVDKQVRAQAGQYVRTRGMDEMPEWLHQDRYALERPGALILLRARLPNTDTERDELRATLESETCPSGGVFALKDVMHQFSPAGLRVTTRTLFYARPISDKPETNDSEEGCGNAADFSVIGPLALLVLKHMEPEDFYGVDAREAESKEWEAPGAEEADAKEDEEEDALQDALALAEGSTVPTEANTSTRIRSADTPMRLLAATLRPMDIKLVVNTSSPADAVQAVARTFLCAEDLPDASSALKGRDDADVPSSIAALGLMLAPRNAIMLVEKTDDGRVKRCTLFSSKGKWLVSPHEAVARYVLFPWATPLIFDGASLNEIQVHAVTREALRLSPAAKTSRLIENESSEEGVPTVAAPVAPAASVNATPVPDLASLVEELRKATSEITAAANAASAATVLASAGAKSAHVAVESTVTRSLKRTIAYLEMDNDSV